MSNSSLLGLFIGFTISLFLYGILGAQVAIFYRSHVARPKAIKIVVLAIFLLESAHTASASWGVWDYTIHLHGNPSDLQITALAFGVLVYVSSITAILCRCVFAYTIFKLNGRKLFFPAIIVLTSLIVLTSSIVYATQGVQGQVWGNQTAVCFYLGGSAEFLSDFTITVNMIVLFRRRSIGLGRADKLTTILLFYFLNTGMIFGICVIGGLLAYLIAPASFAFLSFYVIAGKLYSNSLLGSLNARQVLFPRDHARRHDMQYTMTAPEFSSVLAVHTGDIPPSQIRMMNAIAEADEAVSGPSSLNSLQEQRSEL